MSPETYRFVDDIAEVATARHNERLAAEQLLESRRQEFYTTGEVTYQPVDALSTADSVLVAAKEYGQDSEQYQERYAGLVLDCQRFLGEWYRKKKPEYFEPIRHEFDDTKEEFFSHGLSIRQMTDNALTPIANSPEDEARRINERVEESTPHLLRKLGHIAIGEEAIRTISECTDQAVTEYEDDMANKRPEGRYNGYVPQIEKLMIRDIRLDDQSSDRFEEQIALPGTYISHYIIQKALDGRGLSVGAMNKTELHGSQMVVRDSLMDFVKLLDDVASEEWCVPVFMGEKVPKDYAKNYDSFRQEALSRQESLRDMAVTTAEFVLDLAKDEFDRKKAPAHVEEFVKKQLLELAKQDEVVAEQMFDEKTAAGLQQVAALEQAGRFQEAFELMQTVEKAAPGGGYCGAGSCGLESVNLSSESGKDLLKKLNADSKDTVVKDTERACRCGKKSIVYAYNKNKVNKLCTSCGSFESKASKA